MVPRDRLPCDFQTDYGTAGRSPAASGGRTLHKGQPGIACTACEAGPVRRQLECVGAVGARHLSASRPVTSGDADRARRARGFIPPVLAGACDRGRLQRVGGMRTGACQGGNTGTRCRRIPLPFTLRPFSLGDSGTSGMRCGQNAWVRSARDRDRRSRRNPGRPGGRRAAGRHLPVAARTRPAVERPSRAERWGNSGCAKPSS
jgi:hypothetical protein